MARPFIQQLNLGLILLTSTHNHERIEPIDLISGSKFGTARPQIRD